MTRMTWDGIRAIDFIQTLPAVDPQRIGIFGHSLGAKEALYVAAFDERVKCTRISEGGIGLGFSNWEDGWYLGPQITAAGFGREHHELLALIAPRPFLLLAGESADGDRSWTYMEAALPVYPLVRETHQSGMVQSWCRPSLSSRSATGCGSVSRPGPQVRPPGRVKWCGVSDGRRGLGR